MANGRGIIYQASGSNGVEIYISVKHKESRYTLQDEDHTGATGMSCDEDIILIDKIDPFKTLGTDVVAFWRIP